MSPTLYTAKLAQNPRKMPNAVHICQDMTRAPRILAGEFSAAKMGTELPFRPIPTPMSRRVIKSSSQVWVRAPPISEQTEDSGDEDAATAAEVVVDWVREPAADESTSNIRSSVDQTHEPLVANLIWIAFGLSLSNAEFDGEGQVGSVRSGLVPSLNSSSDRAGDDGEVERQWMGPFVGSFVAEGLLLVFAEDVEAVEIVGRLRDQGTALDQVDFVLETFLFREEFDIGHEIRVGNVRERIADPVISISFADVKDIDRSAVAHLASKFSFKLMVCTMELFRTSDTPFSSNVCFWSMVLESVSPGRRARSSSMQAVEQLPSLGR